MIFIKKNKKGFVFTLIVLMAFLFLGILNPSSTVDVKYKNIHKWENLIDYSITLSKEIESYQIPLVVRSIGYCALNEMATDESFTSGSSPFSSVNDINNKLREIIANGSDKCNMSLKSFLGNLSNNLQIMKYNFTYNLSKLDVKLKEDGPFKVSVDVKFPYNLSLTRIKPFEIRRNLSINVKIPIVGINDPMLTWATRGKYNSSIKIGPTEKIFDYEQEFGINLGEEDEKLIKCYWALKNDEANKTCLNNTIDYHWYLYSPDAPSFIERLLLNFTPSKCCGITTLLNQSIVKVVSTNIRSSNEGVYNWSYMDYCQYQVNPKDSCFFSNQSCRILVNETYDGNYVLIDLFYYDILMNLTAYAEKDDSEVLIYENPKGNCKKLTDVDIYI